MRQDCLALCRRLKTRLAFKRLASEFSCLDLSSMSKTFKITGWPPARFVMLNNSVIYPTSL